jgi:hypothetical protein
VPQRTKKWFGDHSLFSDDPLFLHKSRGGRALLCSYSVCYSRNLHQGVSNSNLTSFLFSLLKSYLPLLKELQFFLIQVSQYKFIVLKIMSRKIFGEFMEVFLKGLNPFKIQTNFKLDLFLGFLFQNPVGI